jgi:hypothetical protein
MLSRLGHAEILRIVEVKVECRDGDMSALFLRRKTMKTSLWVLAAILIIVPAAGAAIFYSPGAGSGAPPATLGSCTVTPFPLDAQAIFADVTSVPIALDGDLQFSIPMSHRRIGSGWASWSHGYTGDVYYSSGATSVTLTLPPSTLAFYFYVEPNPFEMHTFEAVAQDGTSSGEFTAHGQSGATYVGFYGTGGSLLSSIEITGSTDFAIGEFGICNPPEPGSLVMLALGGLVAVRRR